MIGNKKIIAETNGFSLLEVIVALSIFLVVMLAAMNIFQSVIVGQREAIAARNVQESVRYAIEVMSKEIRSGKRDAAGACSGMAGKIFGTNATSSRLNFINIEDECVSYDFSNNNLIVKRGGYQATTTPDNIKVNNFLVSIVEEAATQPRVTLVIDIEAATSPGRKQKLNIQTTVSSKFYD